jgi:endoglucanase
LQKGIPVILGECGALNKDNTEARVAWAEYFAGKGREYGVPVCWWDNGAFTGSGENFGLLNRRELKWEYPEIVEAFNN